MFSTVFPGSAVKLFFSLIISVLFLCLFSFILFVRIINILCCYTYGCFCVSQTLPVITLQNFARIKVKIESKAKKK